RALRLTRRGDADPRRGPGRAQAPVQGRSHPRASLTRAPGSVGPVVAPVPIVRIVRSGLEESVHLGDVAVCDARGRLVAWAGDPNRRIFARSCMKPVQAAVSYRAAEGADTIPDRELAVMCASHNGEPVHLGVVRAVL